MTYTVKWWKDRINGTELHSVEVVYGADAVYVDSTNALAPQFETAKNSYKLFKGWDKSTSFVQSNLDVIAQWESGYAEQDNYPEQGEDWTAAQLYTVAKRKQLINFFSEDGLPNGDRIKVKLGRELTNLNIEKQVIIDTPMTFDGISDLYDTGINLLEEDRD